jgi:hypothetical protein
MSWHQLHSEIKVTGPCIIIIFTHPFICMIFNDLFAIWYGMVWYGMVWYGMVWYGMVWYGMVWYGMVWL